MMRLVLTFLLLVGWMCGGAAQRSRVFRDDIRTLRCEQGGLLQVLPVIGLNGGETVRVSFDQMSHEHRRFFYRVEHCGIDGTATPDLFPSEFLEATQSDVLIEHRRESRNTTTQYTHYSFDFPNAEVRPLISGNYRITIFDDSGEEPTPVAETWVGVVEPLAEIEGEVLTDTDVDNNRAHQQLRFSVFGQDLQGIDLRKEVKVLVCQNGRADRFVEGVEPSQINGTRLLWEHRRELIFPAGNEYRSFEWLSVHAPGMRVEGVDWISPCYHATLMTDEVRQHYHLAGDRNGTSVIRNIDNADDATESEYAFVHFRLAMPELKGAEVYVSGAWAMGDDAPEHRMHYNAERQAYETALYLKQGYYNYLYLVRRKGSRRGETAPVEGDFFQTNNDYTIWVYHRRTTDRYDRLVGVKTLTY